MENTMQNNLSIRETKIEKFIRLAEQRVNSILEQFRKLGNLSNTKNYEYNEDDIKKIFVELNKALRNTKTLFMENGSMKGKKFKL